MYTQYVALLFAPLTGVCSVFTMVFSGDLGTLFGHKLWGAVFTNSISFGCQVVLCYSGPSLRQTASNFVTCWRKEGLFTAFAFFWAPICGVYYLICGVLLPPEIGYSLFFVALVCLEIVFSLILEFTGILWTDKQPMMCQTIFGALILVSGTLIFQIETIISESHLSGIDICYILMSALAGIAVIAQAAFNRKFTLLVVNPFRTCAVGQLLSTLFVLIAALIIHPSVSSEDFIASEHWWYFLGGLCTACTMAGLVILPTYLGYAATVGWLLFGQLLTSFIFDSVGAFSHEKVDASPARISGVLIVLLGVIIVQLGRTDKYSTLLPRALYRLAGRSTIHSKTISSLRSSEFSQNDSEVGNGDKDSDEMEDKDMSGSSDNSPSITIALYPNDEKCYLDSEVSTPSSQLAAL